MLVYGDLVVAGLEELAADPVTALFGGRLYRNTTTGAIRYYNGSGWKNVASDGIPVSDSGILNPTAGASSATLQIPQMTLAQRTALVSPVTGRLVYDTTMNSLFVYTGSTWIAAGSGSGGSGANVIANPNDANAGWVASNTGITVATTTTASDLPVGGVIPSAIKITPVSGTDYVYYRFTMPAAWKNTRLPISFDQRPLSGYAAGDLKLDLYTNSASNYGGSYTRLPLDTDVSSVTSIPNVTGKFGTSYDPDPNADYYELRIARVSGTTALNITNVFIGPVALLTVPQIGRDRTDLSTVFSLSNMGTGAVFKGGTWKQDVDRLKAQFTVALGTSLPASPAALNLIGLNLDTSRLYPQLSPTPIDILGHYSAPTVSSGPANLFDPAVATVGVLSWYSTGGAQKMYFVRNQNSGNFLITNANDTWQSGSLLTITVDIPIAEWAGAGGAYVGQNDVEYASTNGTWNANDSTTSYDPGGSLMGGALTAAREKTITWQKPVQRTDRIQVWASKDQVNWFPINGALIGGTNTDPVILTTDSDSNMGSGVAWRPGSTAYQTVVRFAVYRSRANDDTPGVDWPSTAAYWLVTKSRAGSPVSFGHAGPTVSGLAPAGVFSLGENQVINLQPRSTNPANPASSTDIKQYVKGSLLVFVYNDGGTVRFKYLDMAGTGVTWVHTTTPP